MFVMNTIALSGSDKTSITDSAVDFSGDRGAATLTQAGEIYVPARSIVKARGLADEPEQPYPADEVLARRVRKVLIHGIDGKARDMLCLPLKLFAGWICGVIH